LIEIKATKVGEFMFCKNCKVVFTDKKASEQHVFSSKDVVLKHGP
jgi:uncharacterized C2H2 Zn-finger protein